MNKDELYNLCTNFIPKEKPILKEIFLNLQSTGFNKETVENDLKSYPEYLHPLINWVFLEQQFNININQQDLAIALSPLKIPKDIAYSLAESLNNPASVIQLLLNMTWLQEQTRLLLFNSFYYLLLHLNEEFIEYSLQTLKDSFDYTLKDEKDIHDLCLVGNFPVQFLDATGWSKASIDYLQLNKESLSLDLNILKKLYLGYAASNPINKRIEELSKSFYLNGFNDKLAKEIIESGISYNKDFIKNLSPKVEVVPGENNEKILKINLF